MIELLSGEREESLLILPSSQPLSGPHVNPLYVGVLLVTSNKSTPLTSYLFKSLNVSNVCRNRHLEFQIMSET